jgi:hypothetical protein
MTDQTFGKTPSVAVIGSGSWGKDLIRNFHQLNALHPICDKSVIMPLKSVGLMNVGKDLLISWNVYPATKNR